MLFKLLNGAASPANCARKIPGPLMVLIVSSTPPSIYDELLRRAFFRRIRSQEQRHVRDVIGKHTPLQTLTRHNFLLHFRRIPQFDLPLGPHSPGRNGVHPYPGAVWTERQIKLWYTPEVEKEIMAGQCLKRRVLPDDVANMALFLASDAAEKCTAQEFIVDGGWS